MSIVVETATVTYREKYQDQKNLKNIKNMLQYDYLCFNMFLSSQG